MMKENELPYSMASFKEIMASTYIAKLIFNKCRSHQIKGGVGIPGHIAVRVGLGDQIAVAVVDINGAVAKRVHLHRGGDGDFYALLELTVT